VVDSPSGGSRLCWDTYPWGLKLNKTYRTVWSQRLGCWVAVAETARARGKGGASKAGALAVALMAGTWAAPAAADGMHGVPGLSNTRLTDGAAVGVMSQLLQATTNAAPSVAPVASAVQQGVSQTAAALAGIGAPILPPASALQQVPIAEAVPSLPVVGEVLAATPVPAAVQAIAAAPAAVTKKVGSALPGKAGKAVESVPAKLAEVLASAPVDKSRNAAVPADDAVASAASLGSVATLSNSVPASPMSPLSGNGTLGILPTGGSLFPSSSNRQTMAVAASSGSEPPPLNPPAPTGLVIGTAGLLGGVGQGLQPLTMSLFGQKEAWMRSGALSVNRENINARFSVVNVLGIPILDLAPVTGTLQGTLGGPLPEQKLTLLGGVTSGNYITNINSGLTYNNGLLLPGTQPPSWVDRNNCLNVLGLAGATCWDIPAAQNNQVLIGDGASANGSQEVVIGTNAKHILPNEDAGTIFTDPNMPGVPDTNYAARKGHSVLIGDSTYGNANGQTIVGASASSTVAGGVALGFQSVSDREGGGREVFSNVAVPVRGAVSVGSAGNERQIINVAGGTADTDAVNVRQLKAVADQIDGIDANSVKYDDATRGKVTLAGAGGTVVTNVKAGEVSATSTDAVNGSQLNETNTNVTNVDNRVTNIDNGGTKYFKANSTLAAASATGTDSVAAGGASVASAANAVALGNGANASMANSIALGAGSTTTVGAQSDYAAFALTARQSSAGEVSVGSAGATRRITNVSAGSADTDATNVAQLKAVDGRISEVDKLAMKYDDDTKTKATLGGAGGTLVTNVKAGDVSATSTDAVNGSQLHETNTNVTNVDNRVTNIDNNGTKYFKANSTLAAASATGTDSVSAGGASVASAANAVALGNGANASMANSVALGAGSTTTVGAQSDYAAYALTARQSSAGEVSVGSAGATRRITNVSAGSADSDAANVAQLKAVDGRIGEVDKLAVKYDDDTKTRITLNAGGTGTVVTNVKAGEVSATSTDAVNGSQLNETNTNVTNVDNRVTNIDNNGTKYFKANSTLAAASASGTDSVAAGGASVASAANAVALGNGANASMANSVALGAGSTTTVGAQSDYVAYALTARQSSAGEVSVGSAGATRRITNVSAGSADTDAANIAQLKAVDGRIGEMDKLAVKYDDDTKSKITLNAGGTSTVISNVGRGAVTSSSTDAINGSQLWGWTQDETNIMSNLSLYKRINDIDSDTKYFKANSTLAGAQATGTNSVAAGPAAVSGGANSVAMGNGATTSADNSVAVGGASAASGTASTAVGSGATATGAQATAMGSGATASGANSTAMGTGSKATGESSTAIGANADASAKNSVALGAGSVADRDNTVSVGAAGKERQITNVARGTQDTDAVNYAQLKEVSGDITNIQEGKDGMFQIENSLARAKPKPTGKDSVAGGAGAMAEGAAATALGNASIAKGENSTAVGNSAQALGVNSTVVGNSALASGANASAFGTGAKAEGSGSMAMGNGAQTGAAATNSVAIGNQANATQSNTVALGNNAQATVANSMALGTGAQASGANSVALGTNSVADRPNVVSVGAAGQERQIANVGDGTADTDAVNLRQLRSATSDFTSSISSVRDDLRRVERNANAGAASAMAVAGLPQAYTPGRSMASAAASHYLGQSAIAVGLSTISENGRWVYKIAGNVNSQGKVGAVIGAGYQW